MILECKDLVIGYDNRIVMKNLNFTIVSNTKSIKYIFMVFIFGLSIIYLIV